MCGRRGSPTAVLAPSSWHKLTAAAPWSAQAIDGNRLVVLNGQIILMGRNDVWGSTDGATWTELTTAAPWSGRQEHTTVVLNGQIVLMGGEGHGPRSLGEAAAAAVR